MLLPPVPGAAPFADAASDADQAAAAPARPARRAIILELGPHALAEVCAFLPDRALGRLDCARAGARVRDHRNHAATDASPLGSQRCALISHVSIFQRSASRSGTAPPG